MKLRLAYSLIGLIVFFSAQSQITNVALNQQVIVDSNFRPPENLGPMAVDGIKDVDNIDSRWVSGNGYPHFIEIDFDVAYSVSQVVFYTGYKQYNHPVKDYQIQYWDGTDWIDIVNKKGNSLSVVTENFTPVSTEKVRLYATKGSDAILRLYEIEVYGQADDGSDNNGGGPVGTGLWQANGDTLYTEVGIPVGIGTPNPDAPLTVKGQIHCEEVRVDLEIPAPDYVFADDYNLPTLAEIEKFYLEHQHLPYLPKGEVMEESGANIGQNQYAILRTLEEMMLHQVQLQKELEVLKAQNQQLVKKLKLQDQ